MNKYLSFFSLSLLVIFLSSSLAAKCGREDIPWRKSTGGKSDSESEYVISFDKSITSKVSSKLLGFNLVYPHEKNSVWQDGNIAGYLRNVHIAFLRYPGGTVCSYYHWNSLTGEGWKDSWDPQHPVTSKNPSEYMDIDEYMALVKSTRATPLVGINMSSGWRWNRTEDGIKEAIALMQYCKDKKFTVKYWFLDNEPYQKDSNGGAKTPEEYAGLINAYAPAMKSFDPDIKIVVNWNSAFDKKRSDYSKLIQLAGSNIDIVDVHWYWSYSKPDWEKWLSKTPMTVWTGSSYIEEIAYFRQMVKDFGHPDIELASFEWNIGPPKLGNFTVNRAAITQAEMMMQFIKGGLDYAVFWPIHWPTNSSKIRSFVDTSTNAASPDYLLFQFLGKMQGGILINTQVQKPEKDMIVVAVQDADLKTLRICVLNKNPRDIVTDIQMDKFPGMRFKEAKVYAVNDDGSKYSFVNVKLLKSEKTEITKFLSKGISFTMLTFKKQ